MPSITSIANHLTPIPAAPVVKPQVKDEDAPPSIPTPTPAAKDPIETVDINVKPPVDNPVVPTANTYNALANASKSTIVGSNVNLQA